ncbi:MAG TPA: SGNH/GDSL hydrolase family protein [Candidatus Hydrogenedentes bacterium]|jgi:lysophospholipase L1-like esterase|nr:SGNH/GDSL hydrolase family protein [Candidatus Hydrogenedentota bacterium]HPJ98881.1 SGNH/GDSL hydrolase family protein [Candidatus Hydrogenedentota bacterium]
MTVSHRTRSALWIVLLLAAWSGGSAVSQENSPAAVPLDPATATTEFGEGLLWYDAANLPIDGKGWNDVAACYDRLPARAEGVVRPPVWNLSRDSAGLAIRFQTDSPAIAARWVLRDSNLAMPHMPATGVSGLDLYVKLADRWMWVANGRPSQVTMQASLVTGIPEGMREYLLYLPLYNGVTSVHIGINPDSVLAAPPERSETTRSPVLFWGTSITQGGCASRPGMAYPSIVGRMMDRPTINLGFSGNGKLEPEMAAFIAELDVAVFVLDCCPNLKPEEIAERTEPVVQVLREAHPDTPIVLMENIIYQSGYFLPGTRRAYEAKNAELKAAYERLTAAGVTNLHYIPCDNLLGDDAEATVDGTHATDLGFQRMAEAVTPILKSLAGE